MKMSANRSGLYGRALRDKSNRDMPPRGRTPSGSSFGSQLIVHKPSNSDLPSRERVTSGSSGVKNLINQFEGFDSSSLSLSQDEPVGEPEEEPEEEHNNIDDWADEAFNRSPFPQSHFSPPRKGPSPPSSPPRFASPPGSASSSPRFATPKTTNFDDLEQYCLLSPEEIQQAMSSPAHELFEKHPRITMTPSMLYAHAHLRGSAEKETDPVLQALYLGASRSDFKDPVTLPIIEKTTSMEAFHKGAQYFYDPLNQVKEAPNSAPHEPREKSNQSYDEFMATFKPTIGRHHTRGSKVYSNFGYLNDGGNWVDPDSIGSMNDSMLRNENRQDSAQFTNDLPDLPTTHKGPKIMSEEELNEFYASYENEVEDDIDGEGDPRQYRITPAMFARLAQGAVRGDVFEENELDPSVFDKLGLSGPLASPPRRHRTPEENYDLQDGSRMSDVRTTSTNPSMQSSPRGVNLNKAHRQYAYLNPQAAYNMPLHDYSAQTGNPVELMQPASSSPSSTSDLHTMTEQIAVAALGSVEVFDEVVVEVVEQRKEYRMLEHERAVAQIELSGKKEKKSDLMRDVWFLKREVQEKKDADEKAEKARLARKEEKRKERVKRYLAEQKQQLEVSIWREAQEGKRLREEGEVLTKEVEELKAEKRRLYRELGGVYESGDEADGRN